MRCFWCGNEVIYPFTFNPPVTVQNDRVATIKSLLQGKTYCSDRCLRIAVQAIDFDNDKEDEEK